MKCLYICTEDGTYIPLEDAFLVYDEVNERTNEIKPVPSNIVANMADISFEYDSEGQLVAFTGNYDKIIPE